MSDRSASLRRILDKFQEHKSASTVEPGSHQGDTQLLAPSATITTGKFHVLLGLNVDESEDLTPSTDSALSGQESAAGLEVEASEEDSYVVQDDGMAGKLELVLAILVSALVSSCLPSQDQSARAFIDSRLTLHLGT